MSAVLGWTRLCALSSLRLHSDSPVLITGETGTGKTLAAKAVHYRSKLASFPFISINCAALPENLIEAELFGYDKGAFTGAVSGKEGHLRDGRRRARSFWTRSGRCRSICSPSC